MKDKNEQADPIEAHFAETSALLEILRNDTALAFELHRKYPVEDFFKRAYIRCFFANAEAVLYRLRGIVIELHKYDGAKLTIQELSEISETGGRFLKAKDALTKTISAFEKTWGCSSEMDCKDRGYQDYLRTMKVRDRLMHPKRLSDMAVHAKEMATAQSASLWFRKLFGRMGVSLAGALRKTAKRD